MVSRRLPLAATRSDRVGFVVDKMSMGQVFSEYFGFPRQFLFHRLLHIHHHISYIIDQLVADVPNGLSLTPRQETKEKLTSRGNINFSNRIPLPGGIYLFIQQTNYLMTEVVVCRRILDLLRHVSHGTDHLLRGYLHSPRRVCGCGPG
jgi:hypothetical protein